MTGLLSAYRLLRTIISCCGCGCPSDVNPSDAWTCAGCGAFNSVR